MGFFIECTRILFQFIVIGMLVGFLCRLMDVEARVESIELYLRRRDNKAPTPPPSEASTCSPCVYESEQTAEEDLPETAEALPEALPDEEKLITQDHLTSFDERLRKMTLGDLCVLAETDYNVSIVNEKTGKKKHRGNIIREILAKI